MLREDERGKKRWQEASQLNEWVQGDKTFGGSNTALRGKKKL